ncbi:hypothetical protein FRC17_009175 [Serendipita sp. 399]|nr:hypothetical protein FRC17_009175 [Serendipita sp. 399]
MEVSQKGHIDHSDHYGFGDGSGTGCDVGRGREVDIGGSEAPYPPFPWSSPPVTLSDGSESGVARGGHARDDEADSGVDRDEDEDNNDANTCTNSDADHTPHIHLGRKKHARGGERGHNGVIDALDQGGIMRGIAGDSKCEQGGRGRVVPLNDINVALGC